MLLFCLWLNRERQPPGRLFFLLAAKERTKENCRCFDAADPRLRGCTPLRTPKRRSEVSAAKRTQYYCPFLTPPSLPPIVNSGVPPNPRCRKQQSVGEGFIPPGAFAFPLASGPLPPTLSQLYHTLFPPPLQGVVKISLQISLSICAIIEKV